MCIIPPEGGGPNAGFIVFGDQVLVIDSVMSPGLGQKLLKDLRKVTKNPPTYFANTHNHGDHVLGNQAFSAPATIIGHENVREALLSQREVMIKSFAERYSSLVPDIEATTLLPPQITYRDRMTLHFD